MEFLRRVFGSMRTNSMRFVDCLGSRVLGFFGGGEEVGALDG